MGGDDINVFEGPTIASATTHSAHAFILDLPLELRYMIYDFVFASLPHPLEDANIRDLEPTALLQVSRQIRYEVVHEFHKWLLKWSKDVGEGLATTLAKLPSGISLAMSLEEMDALKAKFQDIIARQKKMRQVTIALADLFARSQQRR